MLINAHNPKDDDGIHADIWGVFAVINDLYDRLPENFGTPEIREKLRTDLSAYYADDNKKLETKEFFKFFAERLQHYNLNPFFDISIANIGLDDSCISDMQPILRRFQRVYTFDGSQKLMLETALDKTKGQKVDYVVTGNVLNYGGYEARANQNPLDSIFACAQLLKKDGRAIHMLNYHFAGDLDLSNPDLFSFLKQTSVYNVPTGNYRKNVTQVMVLRQDQEVELTLPMRNYFQLRTNHIANTRHRDWFNDSPPQEVPNDETISTRDGKYSFSLNKYYDYFVRNPERVSQVRFMDWEMMQPPETLLKAAEDNEQGHPYIKEFVQDLIQHCRRDPAFICPLADKKRLSHEEGLLLIESYLQQRDEMIRDISIEMGIKKESPATTVASASVAAQKKIQRGSDSELNL